MVFRRPYCTDFCLFNNIVDLAIMSIGPANKETTYKYSIDGDILTLTIEQHDEHNNLNTIISAKFKKVAE